jgi:hypothetical protein
LNLSIRQYKIVKGIAVVAFKLSDFIYAELLQVTQPSPDSFSSRCCVLTTGKNVCADGQKLRRRPNIGAVGVAPSHGSRANGPSG